MSTQSELKLYELPEDRFLQLVAEVWISNSSAAPTAATRWTCLTNNTSTEFNKNQTTRASMKAVDAVRRPAREHVSEIDPQFTFTANCLTNEVMQSLLGADPDFSFGSDPSSNAQASGSSASITDFDFDEGADGVGIAKNSRTPILDGSGNHVRSITALALAGTESAYGADEDDTTLVEGVDYLLDSQNGTILWLKAINNDVITGTASWSAITSASNNYLSAFRMFTRVAKTRYFSIVWRDQDDLDNIVIETPWLGAHAIKGSIKVEAGFTADGQNDAEVPLMLRVLNDPTFMVRTRS